MNRTNHFMTDGVVWRYSDITVHGCNIDMRLRRAPFLSRWMSSRWDHHVTTKWQNVFLPTRQRRIILPEDVVASAHIDFSRISDFSRRQVKIAVKIVVFLSSA
jgi:hypothetical protein